MCLRAPRVVPTSWRAGSNFQEGARAEAKKSLRFDFIFRLGLLSDRTELFPKIWQKKKAKKGQIHL